MASRVEGLEQTRKGLRAARAQLQRSVPLVAMGSRLRTAMRKQVREQGGGRWYPMPGHGKLATSRWSRSFRKYRASAPGQPPASPTGNLHRAVRMRVAKQGDEVTAVTVGVHGRRGIAALAKILEEKLNRPFVFQTYAREKANLLRLAHTSWPKAVEKAQQALVAARSVG